jgi:tetratricopeptide (TPR) repeat protein
VVEGPADSISTLIDGLAAKLLVSEAGEDEGVASYTTSSLRALRAYLAGQREMRLNHYVEAVADYRTALALDPAFALAGLRLALAADRLHQVEERRQGIFTAWGSRRSLSERDLALLISYAGPRYPLPSSSADQLTVWRHLVELTPNNAESWYLYGAHLLHAGALVGVAEPEEQALVLLQRALAFDREYMPAKLLIAHLATRSSPPAELKAERVAVDSSNPFAPYLRWRIAVATGDSAALRRIRGTLRGVGPANLRAIAMASQFDGAGLGDGALALGISQSRTASLSEQIDLILAQHSLALLQGRPHAAFEAATRLAVLQPGSQAYLRLRVLDALYAEGDTAAASGAARQLQRLVSGGVPLGAFAAETRLANLCVLGQWRLSRGDTVGMASSIESLGHAGTAGQSFYPVSTPAPVCASLLQAWLASLKAPAEASPYVEGVDTLVLTPEVAGDAISYAPILIARLYERAGQPQRALQAIRKRSYMSGWPRYLATAWREEGRLAELNGDRAAARESYDRYLVLRSNPDSSVLPQVEQVRSLRGAL